MKTRSYIAIDLKSFYASVECIERGLDPMKTNLIVADQSRTEKTIGLAVSPSLKSFGIAGRARLFEAIQRIREVNLERRRKAKRQVGKSSNIDEINKNPYLAVDFIIAPPQMAKYIKYSTKIYNIYLKYFAKEDIHVYSIDEVFIDATNYLKTYKLSAHDLAMKIILDVLKETKITATAGIGTNLYLAKVAMDIVAKHIPADENGVRIAELDEASYRKELWNHQPLTDFWRVGKGYQKKLEAIGIKTMGDIARCSIGKDNEYYNEDKLYKLFGVNAELLIDHAWGYEPCEMKDIKNYRPVSSSLSTGQVLHEPYSSKKARLIVREMIDGLVLDLVDKKLVTDQIVLTVGYDIGNLDDKDYQGEVVVDYYGRQIPKHAHGTANLKSHSSSTSQITKAVLDLYDKIINPSLSVRRIMIAACNIMTEDDAKKKYKYQQLDIFSVDEDYQKQAQELEKEKKLQNTMLNIKKKFGKNAILKGMNFEEGATAKDRNSQIGGHKA